MGVVFCEALGVVEAAVAKVAKVKFLEPPHIRMYLTAGVDCDAVVGVVVQVHVPALT